MEHDRVEDDLKAIRQIMERTRKATDKGGGWIMVLWGGIWFVGFLCSQFVQNNVIAWIWAGLNTVGMGGTIWLALRMRGRGVSSPFWRPIVFWWASLIAFDWLIVWLLHIRTGSDLLLLILLTVALGYVQFGLFTHWAISATGVALAALAVGATLLIPDYFYLAMAVLGGGVLAGTGLWFVWQER
jgi:hypothetical protein